MMNTTNIKNTQIIEDDINGAFYDCPEGKIPSFVPINYDRRKIEIVEQKQEKAARNADIPEPTTPEIPDIPKEKETIKILAKKYKANPFKFVIHTNLPEQLLE